jgi:acyl dehydratase
MRRETYRAVGFIDCLAGGNVLIQDPFDALAIGQRRVSRGRTLTETDVVNFCMLTGNWLELHANREFAAQTQFGQRIVQGSLIFSIGNALIPFDPEVVEAFYGVERLRFLRPSFINDTIRSSAEIIALRERGAHHGVATLDLQVHNQRDETVMRCEFSLLIRKQRLLAQQGGAA